MNWLIFSLQVMLVLVELICGLKVMREGAYHKIKDDEKSVTLDEFYAKVCCGENDAGDGFILPHKFMGRPTSCKVRLIILSH